MSAPMASLSTAILTECAAGRLQHDSDPAARRGNVLGGLLPQSLGAKHDAPIRPYGFILLTLLS
jgi:hypothetical protein